jgi:hypothetical protein
METKEWRTTAFGEGYWEGTVDYTNNSRGVRWTTQGGEIQIATTGHGGIDADTALAMADAIRVAVARATNALYATVVPVEKEND